MIGSAMLDELRSRTGEMRAALTTLVEHESPSRDKSALDGLADFIAERFRRIGGAVERVANPVGGNHLIIRFAGSREARKPGLILGHFDTVWPRGTLARMPVRTDGDRFFGPGIFDMKASLVMAEYAMRALQSQGRNCRGPGSSCSPRTRRSAVRPRAR